MSTILPKFTLYSALNLKTTPDDTNNALAILLMFLPLTDLNSVVNGRVLFFFLQLFRRSFSSLTELN